MRLKSFYAKTLTEAMHMIRDTLGEDAIIVATREENGGKAVRVTAAVDPSDTPYGYAPVPTAPNFEINKPITGPSVSDSWLQYDDEQESDENTITEDLTDIMLAHSAPEDVTDQILSCAMVVGYRDVTAALEDSLDHLYQYRPILSTKPATKPIIFVGPPGVGKTLMVAKFATKCVMNGQTVSVITADTQRAGGAEQLSAFTKILNTPLKRVKTAADLARAVSEQRGTDYVFIDTAGTLPYDTDDVRDLARLLASIDGEPVLALPAGMDSTESGEISRIFATLGVRRMVATRLDVGRRLGGVLAAAHQGGLAFAETSFSPQVADGIAPLTPRRLTEFLLPKHKRAATRSTSTVSAPISKPFPQRSTSG